jgi:hypothetical protein
MRAGCACQSRLLPSTSVRNNTTMSIAGMSQQYNRVASAAALLVPIEYSS